MSTLLSLYPSPCQDFCIAGAVRIAGAIPFQEHSRTVHELTRHTQFKNFGPYKNVREVKGQAEYCGRFFSKGKPPCLLMSYNDVWTGNGLMSRSYCPFLNLRGHKLTTMDSGPLKGVM